MGRTQRMTNRNAEYRGGLTIAQVCPRYYPHRGGVETHVQEISESLAGRGVNVEVLTTDPTGGLPKEEVINRVTVRRFHSIAPGEAYFFSPGLFGFLRSHSADYGVVHAHGYHSFPSLYAGLSKETNKLVFTPHYHGVGHTFLRNLLHVPYRPLGRATFDHSDSIVCVSNFEKLRVIGSFGVDEKKIAIVPNGVNLAELTRVKREVRSPPRVLYVGRLEKYKRVDCLIESMNFLRDGAILEIVGTGPDLRRLTELVSQLGLKERVEFAGTLTRAELLGRFSEASVFVSLSKHEAFGITVAEALAVGVPTVVADESALSEFVDGVNCLGVEDSHNHELVAATVSNAMGRIIPGVIPVSWTDVAERILEIYGVVLAN